MSLLYSFIYLSRLVLLYNMLVFWNKNASLNPINCVFFKEKTLKRIPYHFLLAVGCCCSNPQLHKLNKQKRMMHITFQLSKGKSPSTFSQKSWKKHSGELQHSQNINTASAVWKKITSSSNPPPRVLQVPTVSFQGRGYIKFSHLLFTPIASRWTNSARASDWSCTLSISRNRAKPRQLAEKKHKDVATRKVANLIKKMGLPSLKLTAKAPENGPGPKRN